MSHLDIDSISFLPEQIYFGDFTISVKEFIKIPGFLAKKLVTTWHKQTCQNMLLKVDHDNRGNESCQSENFYSTVCEFDGNLQCFDQF